MKTKVLLFLFFVIIIIPIFALWYNETHAPKSTPIVTRTPLAMPTPTNTLTANLTASLVAVEFPSDPPPNFLNLDGSVSNVGNGTAYNAGLHVVAYDAQGVLQINSTVPLAFQEEFTNPFGSYQAGSGLIGGSGSVTTLSRGQAFQIRLNIYHSGIVVNWTVTPIWTNTP